jgi:cell division protease FtsH
MHTQTPRPHAPARTRRRHALWLLLLAVLIVISGAACWIATERSAQQLPYGQFKKRLIRKEILSVRVGPTAIAGYLRPARPGVRPVAFHTSRLGMEQDTSLARLLDENIPEGAYAAESGPTLAETILAPLLIMAVLIGGFALVVRKTGGMGSALAFAKSRPRVYDKDERRVTFADVAGNDEAVAELREVVEFLRTPEKYQAIGGRIPKGVLLVGPPGTGKTLLAKAVAGEAGVPFFSLSGSDFVEMFVGVGAARVRSLFAQAEAKAPCLIFIDELDALGKARGSGGPGSHDERDQTLNQLLVQMDGFDANRGIILIAATNRPETLDAALVRPGRFDRQVVVDRPDITGREQILRVHSRSVALDDAINLRQIAAMTSGFVGADLANLVNEAALLAARKGKDRVSCDEFQEGVERVIAGPEKRQRILRNEERRRIACHEAGHALVARCLPETDPVHKVSILGRGNGALGYTMYRPEDDRFLHTQSWLENAICSLLGGTIAEELVQGEVSDGCTSDLQRATQIARKMVTEFGMSARLGRVSYQTQARNPFPNAGDAKGEAWSQETAREIDLEVRTVLDRCEQATRQILQGRRAALDAITDLLLECESIDGSELQAVIEQHP